MTSADRSRRHESLEASTFACGTRSAYVRGCRCQLCRQANTAYARERAAQRKRDLDKSFRDASAVAAPAGAVLRTWTTRSGERRERCYRKGCPGVDGAPCPKGAFLRKDSVAGLCGECRRRVTANGLVPSSRASAHLAALARQGIGRRAVSEASGVAESLVHAVASGTATRIRRRTERALLEVDEGCRADGSLVPAERAWRNVDRLLTLGWSRKAIARAMGSRAASPALQLGRRQVLHRSADRAARLADQVERSRAPRAAARLQFERLVAGGACPRCAQSHEGDPLAARWCLEHLGAPLSEQELLNTTAGTSPAAARVPQPTKGLS